ncbi:hypothetical protein Tco_1125632 [Tanacetum coccineum]|uniref:Uncharacterized protein n=1 Tax=Tanacetum coccineum TaxID=301880 RepID=A0ABQ5J9H5_9ASTR
MIITNTSSTKSYTNHYQHPWHPLELQYRNDGCSDYVSLRSNNSDKVVPYHGLFVRPMVLTVSSGQRGTSSHQHDDDDDDDVETSRASTPSPTTYLNSLDPLNYQNYQMPSASEQTDETLFERQTTLLNQMQEMHKEMRGGFKSFGKALKRVFSKKKK